MASLSFKGKAFVQNHHLTVPFHQLVPRKDKSLSDKVRLDDNLIIHGDNLKALKALLPTYAGKVKCIYIDPPYNTGNEGWVYNDNLNSPMMQEWLGKVVDREDLTRHDKWLCMMTPRLKLLRELLSQDGVIFVSIDNNEIHRLRLLMDEVFCDQYVSHLAWKGKSGAEDDDYFRTTNEHILCYAKDLSAFNAGRQLKTDEVFPKYDRSKKRNYKTQLARKWGSNSRRQDRPNLYYPVKGPEGNVHPVLPDGKDGCWRWSKDRMQEEIAKGNIEFEKIDGKWVVYQKIYEPAPDESPRTKKYNTWLDDVGSTSNGTDELKEIFTRSPFDHPKPGALIKRLLLMAGVGDKDIVLDSFAGSGTTGQAVLELNKENGNSNRFILLECEDYADKITAERLRRVLKGLPGSSNENLRDGLDGTFSYFELGKPLEFDGMLAGKSLPAYDELARYIFYTATGQDFDERKMDEKKFFIGSTKEYDLYLFYKPDVEFLKTTALTLERARALGATKGRRRLVFAPTKYLDQDQLAEHQIDFAQLPFEIYRRA